MTSQFEWGGAAAKRGRRREAEEFLAETLREGAKPSQAIFQEAQAAGIARRTLGRAKAGLRVRSFKLKFSGLWFWVLPLEDEDAHPATKILTPTEAEHLRRSGGGKDSYANQLAEDDQLAMGEHLRQT